MDNLKPCPFCGGSVKFIILDDEFNAHDEEYEKDPWSGLLYGLYHSVKENEDCPIANQDGEMLGSYGGMKRLFRQDPERYLYRGAVEGMTGRFFVSVDYGTHNPCSMGLWCVQAGRAIRISERYFDSREAGFQRTDEEHYQELEELARGRMIEAVIVDPSAASFLECIRRHGRFLVRPAENSYDTQKEAIEAWNRRAEENGGVH